MIDGSLALHFPGSNVGPLAVSPFSSSWPAHQVPARPFGNDAALAAPAKVTAAAARMIRSFFIGVSLEFIWFIQLRGGAPFQQSVAKKLLAKRERLTERIIR